jgi:hypothetical protein
MLEYIERRLTDLHVLDPLTSRICLSVPRATLRHIDRLPLQSEVRVRAPHLGRAELAERLTINEGTAPNSEPPGDGLRYLPAAIVPKESWRSLSVDELDTLLARSESDTWKIGSDVALVRIPDDVIVPLENIFEARGTRSALDPQRYRLHTDHPEWSVAYERFAEHLTKRYSVRLHTPEAVLLATAPPGMRTVTKDKVSGVEEHYYVGMHLDTWEKIPMWQRKTARNRICVNLGREDRHLLFINLTMQTMCDLLGHGDLAQSSAYYGTDLGHEFMKAYPAYPVTRLRLRSREAYIAPTDNFVHDGSSAGGHYPDIALHMLGYFGLTETLATRHARASQAAANSL